MQNIHGDALRGQLDGLLLAALEHGPAHGFEILRRLEAASGGALKLKEGSVYPALYRLEASKLLKSEWEESTRRARGPRRRIYRLTSKGKRQLVANREQFQQFVRVVGTILGVQV